jgi:hypothetical protein
VSNLAPETLNVPELNRSAFDRIWLGDGKGQADAQ